MVSHKENPAPWRQASRRSYAKHKALHSVRRKLWRKNNPEMAKQAWAKSRAKRWAKDRERILRRNKEHREKHPEYMKAYLAQYYRKNLERYRLFRRNRKARLRGARGSHTAADIREILELQHNKCAYCRVRLTKKTKRHVDHIIALINGGSNERSNLQILCEKCNLKKGRRDPIDHVRQLGMLI